MSLEKSEALPPELMVNPEVEWGRTYRVQRKQNRKKSIAPTSSPLNIQRMWEQYQMSKELEEIRELKRKLLLKPIPRMPKLPTSRIDPNTISKKKYYDYMSTPRQYHEPPPMPDPFKRKYKREVCSPRLIHLAIPTKIRVLNTWKEYQNSLPIDFITRLEELLHADHNLDPKFARCYFKTLDRRKRKQHGKLRKERRRKLRRKRREEKEWLRFQIKTTSDLLIKFLKKEPLFALNFKQMMLSEAILTELQNHGDIKNKPARNTNKPYSRAVVDIVDQLSVWMDTIVRYVDVQYTESIEEIVEVPSLESLLGEEEEEEEGEEYEAAHKRFSLPPLPPLPDMPPLPEVPGMVPLIIEEAEGADTTYETTAVIEALFQEVAGSEAEEGTLRDLSIGGDTLEMLINILSYSTPEMLKELINADALPGVTYQDILDRLNELHDKVLAEQKKQRQVALEEAMVAWARANQPDKVDKHIMDKIQDAAGIISECLMKEAKAVTITEPEKEAELAWVSAEETTYSPDTTELEPSASTEEMTSEVTGQDEWISPETAKALETLREEGEEGDVSEMKSATSVPTLEAAEILHFAEGGGEDEGNIFEFSVEGEEDQVAALIVKPDTEALSAEVTSDLKVVMEEVPLSELSQDVLGVTLPQIVEEEEVEKKEEPAPAMPGVSSIPTVIPAHKPSKVFEHQPDTICCLTLKVWATWLLEVAHNAHAWSKWLNDIINEVRRIASIIRGEVKDADGNAVVFYKEDWIEFSEKVDNMITSWRQYSMHVKDLTDKIVNNFRGKTVTCCPKCLEDNLIVDVTLAHNISQQLAEAMNTAGYWRRWLDSVVMETKRLTGAALTDNESQASNYGTMEIIELHEPHAADSEESLYEIEELDPNNEN